MKKFAFAVRAILFFFMFQTITTAWAWEFQPNGAGVKVSWGGEKLAKRSAPAGEQINPSKAGSRYLRIGGDPKDVNRQVGPEEQIQISTQDLWVETNSGSGKVYRGWLPAGTEFVTVSTNDPTLRRAVWIKKCGNDVLNSEKTAIFFRVQATPLGRQVVQTTEAQPASSTQAPPPAAVAEEKPAPVTTPKEKSWLSKNWPWVLGGIAAIVGIAIAAGGHGGGGSSSSLGPSPPPPGNQ